MKIYNTSSEILRSDQTRELQKNAGNRQKASAPQPAAAAPRSDKVQISDAGRAMAAEAAKSTRGELSAERISEVRERILSGAYNSLEVVDQVARKMLASGDI
jgi:anti-sigma28 factor (negative regulator of flagellin synthesis)